MVNYRHYLPQNIHLNKMFRTELFKYAITFELDSDLLPFHFGGLLVGIFFIKAETRRFKCNKNICTHNSNSDLMCGINSVEKCPINRRN